MKLTFHNKQLKAKQLLIIDNELSMLKLLYNFLSTEYNVVVKNSPIEALRWIQDGNKPLLIISEYELPYINGLSFLEIIRTSGLYNKIPIIILSSGDGFEQKLKNLPYNVEGIIRKPFNPTHLKTIINKALNDYEKS